MGKNNIEQLAIAKKYLGQGGSKFRKYCGLPAGSAWCDAYVTTIFAEAGNKDLFCGGTKQTYCPTTIKWCYNNLASIPPYLALPSDIIFFDWELNGVPNHIGFVRERKSCDEIYTIEGNTGNSICANRTRNTKYVQAVFRPHFKAPYKIGTLEVDGLMGYNTIAMLQHVLGCGVDGILGQGTVKALQRKAGASADGLWGKGTSKAVQKMVGTTADGLFGKNSVKALQTWINKQYKPTPSTKTNGQKIGEKANELAYSTAPSEAKYPSGHAKASYKSALEKVYPNRSKWGKAPKVGASCDVFVGTVIRASGVDTNFPRGLADQRPYLAKSTKFTKVLNLTNRNLKESELKNGDIVTYNYKKGGGHICIWYNGKLKHASVNEWYGRTTTEGGRFKISGKNYIQVWRAK